MIEAFEMEKVSPTGRLHVAVVGAEKNGKSRLCSTAPGVKLFLDFDQRAESVAGIKDVYALTLKDPGGYQMPQAAQDTLDIVAKLEASLCLTNLHPNFKHISSDIKINNIILDSGVSLGKCIADFEMYNNKDLGREVKVGPSFSVRIQQNFDAWNAEIKTVESIVLRLFALQVNVYMTLHETLEHADNSTPKEPKFTGKVTVFPERYSRLLRYFNEVWRVKLTNVSNRYLPRVYPLPDYAFDAATTMLLDPVEEPNIEAMIAKHKVKSGQTKVLSVGTK
jgi:hypothetical protein